MSDNKGFSGDEFRALDQAIASFWRNYTRKYKERLAEERALAKTEKEGTEP